MTVIHLVRHGQASFGSDDYDNLSDLGQRQCVLLGEWMRKTGQPVQRILTGAMRRHRQSAQAFWEGYGAPDALQPQHWQTLSGLNEFDHEQVLRVSHPEFAAPEKLANFLASQEHPRAAFQKLFSDGLRRWMDGRYDADYVESWPAFRQRIGALLAEFDSDRFADPAQRNVMAFTSGGPISVACQHLMAIPDRETMQLLAVLMNSSVSKLMRRDGALRLISTNNVAHLESQADRSLISYR